jgi:hypothetical protein
MAWLDTRGVVLHSWKKTKRGTRGGGHRKRVEMEQAQSSGHDIPHLVSDPAACGVVAHKGGSSSFNGSDAFDRQSSDGLIPTAAQRMDSVMAALSNQHSGATTSSKGVDLDMLAQSMSQLMSEEPCVEVRPV